MSARVRIVSRYGKHSPTKLAFNSTKLSLMRLVLFYKLLSRTMVLQLLVLELVGSHSLMFIPSKGMTVPWVLSCCALFPAFYMLQLPQGARRSPVTSPGGLEYIYLLTHNLGLLFRSVGLVSVKFREEMSKTLIKGARKVRRGIWYPL